MTTKDDGGPAFPVVIDNTGRGLQTGIQSGWATGLSLRDWFAGQAMAAIIAKVPLGAAPPGVTDRNEMVAIGAYDYADAMLEARK